VTTVTATPTTLPQAAPPKTPRRRAKVGGQTPGALAVRYLLLAIMFLIMAGPFLYQLSTSLKGPTENIFAYPPQLIPREPTLENYARVGDAIPVWRYIANSLVVATAATITNCVFGAMAGYALARLRFAGRNGVFLVFLATVIIPFEVIMVSVFLTVRGLGLVDTLAGVVLPTAVTGLSILLMYNAFKALPLSVEEAAVIDGASEWQRFRHVALPSVRGTLTVVAIFSFMFAWDEFLWPLIVLKTPDNFTLTVGIQYLSGTFTSDQRVVAAGTMIAVIPLLVAFFSMQRFFFRGVGEGAVKG
jgi:multiple sugar transport system permease protein